MFIKTQDGTELVNMDRLNRVYIDTERGYIRRFIIKADYASGSKGLLHAGRRTVGVLGVYPFEDRAREVLAQIQKNCVASAGFNGRIEDAECAVFQMPAD